MNKNQGFNLKHIIVIIVIASIISALTTGIILNNNFKSLGGIKNIDLFNDEALKDFVKVYSTINSEFYGNLNKNGMIDSAIEGMLDYLDDNYTNYLDEDATNALSEVLNGKYKGIGILMTGRVVQQVFIDTPAYNAGIKALDVIEKVNGIDVTEKEAKYIGDLIKNTEKDTIELEVRRAGKLLSFEIKLEEMDLPVVYHEVVENSKVGYIIIELFSSTVGKQFKKALIDLENQNIESLIIDLRGNTGGYLNGAVDIASMFLEKGTKLFTIETTEGKKTTKDKTDEKRNLPVVFLTNKETASASEILATALIDNIGAVTVGEETFGKGKIQQTLTLKDGTMAKYTSGKWYRPNGKSIDEIGILPNYKVEMEIIRDANDNIIEINDKQFEKAVQILSN